MVLKVTGLSLTWPSNFKNYLCLPSSELVSCQIQRGGWSDGERGGIALLSKASPRCTGLLTIHLFYGQHATRYLYLPHPVGNCITCN